MDAFDGCPQLRLEDLTKDDIASVIQADLVNTPPSQRLESSYPEESSELVQEMLTKAQGVFLWVSLVIRSLNEGLRNADSVSELRQRLRLIPKELDDYIKQILEGLEGFYLEQASQTFQVALSSEIPFRLITMSYIHEDDPKLMVGTTLQPLSEKQIASRQNAAAVRINARCKGLVKIYSRPSR